MNDELFSYYDSELAFLNRQAGQFADQHPEAADKLKLGDSSNSGDRDPHVERLLQGVAFLNARIRHRLDDDFPELSESLLNTLYPHYLTPFPSCAISSFSMNVALVAKDSATGWTIPAQTTLEYGGGPNGASIQYRTSYPVQLLPIEISSVSFWNERFAAPPGTRPAEAKSAMAIQLATLSSEITFADVAREAFPEKDGKKVSSDVLTLRFYLHGQGQARSSYAIYNQLIRSSLRVVCFDSANESQYITLPPSTLKPVGFAPDENLLPADARILPGYRLLHEYFAFPQKFQFVDLCIPRAALKNFGEKLTILIMSADEDEDLSQILNRDSIRLGCTPMVNLFEARTSFPRNFRYTDYPLIADERFPLDYEVFAVKRVAMTSAGRPAQDYCSFYDIYHASDRKVAGYWHSRRTQGGHAGARGTEVSLSLVDHAVHADVMGDATVSVDMLCMNRNTVDPSQTNFNDSAGAPATYLQITGGQHNTKAELVIRPLPMQLRSLRGDWRWRLNSHLTLNHLSLTSNERTEGLREILRLYNVSDLSILTERIEGIVSTSVRQDRVTRRVGDGPHAFARGIELTITFREASYSDGGLFLFASLLRAFLANYCTINSFVEVVIRSEERQRETYRWTALSGTRQLL